MLCQVIYTCIFASFQSRWWPYGMIAENSLESPSVYEATVLESGIQEHVAGSHDWLSRSEMITFWKVGECSLQIHQPLGSVNAGQRECTTY